MGSNNKWMVDFSEIQAGDSCEGCRFVCLIVFYIGLCFFILYYTCLLVCSIEKTN